MNVSLRLRTDEHTLTINPDDYIVGDLNGVVCVPRALVKDTTALLLVRAEADRRIALEIEAGAKFAEATKEDQLHCQSLDPIVKRLG